MSALLAAGGPFPRRGAALVLLLAALVLAGAAALRSVEHDESYSVFVTGAIDRPAWPSTAFSPAEAREPFVARTDAAGTARSLLETDVHPPLYFWALGAWRWLAGDSMLALRGLSVLFALGAVLAWMAAAWRAALPPLAVGLAVTLAYGFGYTGHIARGFALAHLLVAVTVLAALEIRRGVAEGRQRAAAAWAAVAGVSAGLAAFTNYLAVFPAAAVLAWMVLAAPDWNRRWRTALIAGLPFLLVLGGAAYFFVAQKDSRHGQFDPFALVPSVLRLARFNAANLFGGLPLYVEGSASAAVAGALAALLVAAALAVALAWRRLGPTRWLWLGGALAPSAGVLALGAAFGNTPIELRYIAFSAPFAAALIAAAAAAWARTAPRAAAAGFGLVMAVQAAGTLGMALHPATQQPFRRALAAAAQHLGDDGVLLVPFAEDGVGITGGVLREAPPHQKVLVLRLDDAAAAPERAAEFRRAVIVGLGDKAGAEQARAASAALRADPSWHSLGVAWSDYRGGFAEVFEHDAPPPGRSPVAGGRPGTPPRLASDR
jgi:hypothetical protein